MERIDNKIRDLYNGSKRNWGLLMVSFLIFSVIGCSKESIEDKPGRFNSKSIKHDGVKRTYQVYLPINFDAAIPTPLVLALHGGGGTGSRFEKEVSAGTLTTAAEERGMIIVTPDGMDKRWNDGRTEHFGNDRMYDDIGFISTIIDTMIQNYGVDSKRVYATGISNGGFMSIRLALDLSNKIAAIAPVTAQVTEAVTSKIPELPISMMLVNGDLDPLVPYDGGCINNLFDEDDCRGIVLSTDESIMKFLGHNQCTTPGVTEAILDEISNDRTSVEITRYNDCAPGTEVVLVKVVGGGHTWPGGAQYLGPKAVGVVSQEINASEMILDFFLSRPRD